MESVGAPIGNQNAVKGKRWQKALEKALARKGGDVDAGLADVATQVVEAALAGDKDAWQEIGNRMDGKPHQSTSIANEDGTPLLSGVTVSFVKPDSAVS